MVIYYGEMTESDKPETQNKERISKRMARAGLCSRRDAERWIAAGRVKLNGQKLDTPAVTVGPDDVILVDGKRIPDKAATRLWRYHKPEGLVTSHADEKGRKTVFDALPDDLPRVISIGRLDLNTEGLLLLTNNGELSRHLEHPDTGWKRRYRVRVHGRVDESALKDLKKGLTYDGVTYRSIEATIEDAQKKDNGSNTWLNVTLTEGKNREIRKVMEALGLQVSRLIRVSYGPFQLGNLPVGEVEELKAKVIQSAVGKNFK